MDHSKNGQFLIVYFGLKNKSNEKWAISEMDHFENGSFQKWIISKMDHFKNGLFQKWIISKMMRLKWCISGSKWTDSKMDRF